MAKVYSKYHGDAPRGSVYIGRGSKWGNPFVIGKDGTREEVVAKFRDLMMTKEGMVELAQYELAGKNLICYCAPLACHGDVLLEVANGEMD